MNLLTKNENKSSLKQEKLIEKQVDYDFQAAQYIARNSTLKHGIEEYSKLFNSITVKKCEKRNKYENLVVKYRLIKCQNVEKNNFTQEINNKHPKTQNFKNEFFKAQQKILIESEIQNKLVREIDQIKRSLNLLKGDIGHLVSRDESNTLIGSKTSKVKIIADDQLQKVAMAFKKDKDEFKIRAGMQKRFNGNLRNLSFFEKSSLKRLKSDYVDMMVKKKQINDRFNYLEKTNLRINGGQNMECLKNQKNLKANKLYSCLRGIVSLINQMKEKSSLFESQQNDEEIFQGINSDNLKKLQTKILSEYERIKKQIDLKSAIYEKKIIKCNQLHKKSEYLCQSIKTQAQQRHWDQVRTKYAFTNEEKKLYHEKFVKFGKIIKIIFVFLNFIMKSLNYTHKKEEQQKSKMSHNTSQILVSTQNSLKNKLFFEAFDIKTLQMQSIEEKNHQQTENQIKKNYISEILKIYQSLKMQSNEESFDEINQNLFDLLQCDIQKWFQMMLEQNYYKEQFIGIPVYKIQSETQTFSKPKRSNSRSRQERVSVYILPKTRRQFEDEQNEIIQEGNYHQQMFKVFEMKKDQNLTKKHRPFNSFYVWQRKNHLKLSNSYSQEQQHSVQGSNIINQKKLKHSSEHLNVNQAKRVQFLNKVDADYYKMLKSTLIMEKQNTKKNYAFSKGFKRDKYSPHNEILQQKRFQSTFSISFAKKHQRNIKKIFQSIKQTQKIFKKLKLRKKNLQTQRLKRIII